MLKMVLTNSERWRENELCVIDVGSREKNENKD
jgi:hypothetical protein